MATLTVIGSTIIFVQGVHTFFEWVNCRKQENIKITGLDG